MLTCNEVVRLVGSDGWRTAPLSSRLGLAMHLAMCRHCRRYTLQLRRLGVAARRLYRDVVLDPVTVNRTLERVRVAADEGRRRAADEQR